MQLEVGVDSDEMGVKRCVVELRQGYAIRHDWLTQAFVTVSDDVSRIQQPDLRKPR